MSDTHTNSNLQQMANAAASNPNMGSMSQIKVNQNDLTHNQNQNFVPKATQTEPSAIIQDPVSAPGVNESEANTFAGSPVMEEPKIFMATPPVIASQMNGNPGDPVTAGLVQPQQDVIPTSNSVPLSDANFEVDIETQKNMFIKEMVQNGIPVDEAKARAEEKFNKKVNDESEDSSNVESDEDEDSNVFEIIGNADQLKKIELPEEAKNKVLNAKVIKLTEVVDEDLKNIKIHKYNRVDKISALRHLTNAISRYSVPLPALGEYATFRGAQTIDLVTNLVNEDDSPVETVEKTAAMLYDKFISGTITDKYNENGDAVMGINEFMNVFRYNDMYYGLFGIFCASVKEEIESELGCPGCNKSFKIKYNIQNLLDLNGVSDDYKDKITKIIENKSDSRVIKGLVNESTKTTRYKSPESGIIIDMSQPSISKAVRILSQLDPNDKMQAYNAIALMYVDTIYVPDPDTGEWIIYGIDEEIEKDLRANPDKYPDYEPISELFDIIQELTQTDRNLIGDIIQKKYIFGVNFVLHSKCPHCGRELTNNLEIKNMVFQVARGLSVSTSL